MTPLFGRVFIRCGNLHNRLLKDLSGLRSRRQVGNRNGRSSNGSRSGLARPSRLTGRTGSSRSRLGHETEGRAADLFGFEVLSQTNERLGGEASIHAVANRELTDVRIQLNHFRDSESAARELNQLRRSARATGRLTVRGVLAVIGLHVIISFYVLLFCFCSVIESH